MKIAMLGHKRILTREGGVEVVVEELSKRMSQRGNTVVVYNRSGGHVSGKQYSIDNSKEYNGVIIKKVPTIDKKGLAAMTSSFFAAVCAAFGKYDVVHFHAEGPCAMVWIPKIFGKRVIATIHGLDWKCSKWSGFAKKYILFGEKMAVKWADEVIVLSENIKKYLFDQYGRVVKCIPNGIEKPDIIAANIITQKWGLKKDEYILYLGRIVPGKGITYLIEAFKSLKTDKKLVIAGGVSDSDCFMQDLKKQSDGDPRIIYTGFVRDRELEELYSNAYIYVLPSDFEGMPISLLEAMSYGNCCVVSDIPECTSVVEDNAIVFKKGDTVDLQNCIQRLCDNTDEVNHYKSIACDYICSKYNWETVVDATLDLYQGNT